MWWGCYGKTGSGKTLTSLLIAEALAKFEGKRVAYIDTEKSTAFYVRDIPERKVHPAAFDIDILETKSLFEALEAVETIDPNVHGVVVIDSITALWEAAKAAYQGRMTSAGSFPIQAWGPIKKPYKRMLSLLMDGKFHFGLCGREGVKMEEDAEGDSRVTGARMKAESETQFEPHMLIRMVPETLDDGGYKIRAFFEKDRSGILTGKTIDWPTFDTIAPVVRYLAGPDGAAILGTPEDIAARDAEAGERRREAEEAERKATYDQILGAINAAHDLPSLKSAWELTKGKKTKLGEDLFTSLETAKDARKSALVEAA